MISIVLLGSGNVGQHLFNAFNRSKNTTVKQWYSRNIKAIEAFKSKTTICNNLNDLVEADIYILAISDDAIEAVSKQLPFSNRMVLHTSGSVSMYDLDKKHKRGVFYPLQTFSKTVDIEFSEVPICIETEEKSNLEYLKTLAKALGCNWHKISTEQRQTLHLSAVLVNNFTNQLYRIAHEISDLKHIDFNILKPLILETAKKVQSVSPYMAQTGPAKRGDKKTIKKHLKLLENEQHKAIYTLLTKAIQRTHGYKKH